VCVCVRACVCRRVRVRVCAHECMLTGCVVCITCTEDDNLGYTDKEEKGIRVGKPREDIHMQHELNSQRLSLILLDLSHPPSQMIVICII